MMQHFELLEKSPAPRGTFLRAFLFCRDFFGFNPGEGTVFISYVSQSRGTRFKSGVRSVAILSEGVLCVSRLFQVNLEIVP
jgi:hypothetical protein